MLQHVHLLHSDCVQVTVPNDVIETLHLVSSLEAYTVFLATLDPWRLFRMYPSYSMVSLFYLCFVIPTEGRGADRLPRTNEADRGHLMDRVF